MYTETELAKLIKTVEKEFTAHLSKAENMAKSEGANSAASLSKAEDEKKDKKPPTESKDKGKDEAPAEEKEAAPAEGEGEMPPMAAEGEEEAPMAPAAPGAEAAPAAPGEPAMAGHGYDDEDMEHMRQMYASMSREELMAHHDAIRDALDASAAAPAPAPGAPAPEAAPAAPGADGMDKCGPVMKSEQKAKSEICDENPELNSKPKDNAKAMNGDKQNGGIEGQSPKSPKNRSEASKDSKNLHDAMSKTERQDRNGGKIDKTGAPKGSPGAKSPASTDQRNLSDMEKSEDTQNDLQKSLEAEQAKSAELKKSLDTVQEFLTKLVSKVSAPKGKAIMSLDVIAKSEDGVGGTQELSKSEITAKLLQKSADPSLSKSDRAAINAYYLDGANFNTISHLLK